MVWLGEAAVCVIIRGATIYLILCAQSFRYMMSLNSGKPPCEAGPEGGPLCR